MDEPTLIKEIENAEALIVRSRTRVHSSLLENAKELKVIGRAGAGVDNIDVNAAGQKGIIVMNTPGSNSTSVAEHTMALLLSLIRKIPQANQTLKDGGWNKEKFVGMELKGKVLGILGLGKIGKAVALRARSFQMKILVFDPFITPSYLKDLEAESLSLDEVLSRSDILSLHLPATSETFEILNADRLTKVKPGVFILNTARGSLIQEEALVEALQSGKIAGAALDVFPQEPEIHPGLKSLPNVILTPHIAGSTLQAQEMVGLEIAQKVSAYLKMGEISGAVNFPDLPKEEYQRLKPFLNLGRNLGQFMGQVSVGGYETLKISYFGNLVSEDTRLISRHILYGILQSSVPDNLNLINADQVAAERGIQVLEVRSNQERGLAQVIGIQVQGTQLSCSIEGTVMPFQKQRIVSIDQIDVDAPITPRMIFLRNRDTPGVIGSVGTLLAKSEINIANFALGRNENGLAVGIVNVDSKVSLETLKEIQTLSSVQSAFSVELC